jgi:CO/xanthine dehydrogenase FAD-binding subunit
MKPPPFEYAAPGTLAEAVSLLKQHEEAEAKILAGGQSLMPLLNMRLARPELLIDLGKLSELDYIREMDGALAIGAMTSKRAVEQSAVVKSRQPLLHAATLFIGHPQIRNRGTVGGSLAQADPAGEYPALALLLDAELRATGPGGDRVIRADEFFVTYLTTALEPTEVLTEVRMATLGEGTGWSFQEVSRRHGDFAMAGAAVTVSLDGGGRCSEAKIVLFGVGATPLRARAGEEVVNGEQPGDSVFAQAGQKASEALEEPLSDIHAPEEYRRDLARVLTQRALAEAAARAGGAK